MQLQLLQVCAPYSALQGYKFRVKLTPGSQRKGRAGRQVRAFVATAVYINAYTSECM